MGFADVSLVALRVFREVAERGTLTSAAAALGYTQSAVSRQVASLERAAGTPLLERRHDGVRPTTAGHVVLRHAATVLDQIDTAARELAGLPAEAGTVRLGWFTSAGASLLPRALAALRRTHPAIIVITREGSTPALVRALRARKEASKQASATNVAGLVLVAPAIDFTEELMWKGFSPEARRQIETTGVWLRPSEYGDPYPITRNLIEEGRKHLLLGSTIEVGCPVHILQGARDPDVPWKHAFALAHRLPADDVVLTVIQDGDHRLSRPQDIARILAAVAEMG